ncbi:MAG: hypothetical protein M3Y53_01805 [Thermoproteota archaeon]|nr:hypothetical protein [Thermoproteota archaeon]
MTENWLNLGRAHQLNGALGVASMVNGVEITGTNIASDKQIAVNVRYTGNGSSPTTTVEAGAVKLNLVDFLSTFRSLMMGIGSIESLAAGSFRPSLALSGRSRINAEWKSPTEVTIELDGNTTLNDTNFIGITIHK